MGRYLFSILLAILLGYRVGLLRYLIMPGTPFRFGGGKPGEGGAGGSW